MYNRRYEKVFLMLRQEAAGYALGKRPPWGSCVMELKNGKGRLHLTIQGLKSLTYEVYVLAGEESIFCGEICAEKTEGRCELKWEFDPEGTRGKRAEEFHTVLVWAENGAAPLTAYFREKRDWKQSFVPRKKDRMLQEAVSLQAAEASVPKEQVSEEHTKETVAKAAELQQESFHGSFQGLLTKFRQELEELEETGILTRAETEQIRSMGADTETEGDKTEESFGEFCQPFGEGEEWKRISLEEMTLLSQIPLCWQKEFFFLLPYRKYHHLILREKPEGIWLGLPGQFNPADAADAHAFGFHEFRNTEENWGYWVTFLKRTKRDS